MPSQLGTLAGRAPRGGAGVGGVAPRNQFFTFVKMYIVPRRDGLSAL